MQRFPEWTEVAEGLPGSPSAEVGWPERSDTDACGYVCRNLHTTRKGVAGKFQQPASLDDLP